MSYDIIDNNSKKMRNNGKYICVYVFKNKDN